MAKPKIDRVAVTLVFLWLGFLWVLADRLKLIDGVRFPSPVAIFQVLSNPRFLSDFAIFLLEVAVISLLGGGIGLVLGTVLNRFEWLARSSIRFLRLGLWLPFFMAWALPILPFWRLRPPRELDQFLLLELLFNAFVVVFPTVVFAACYRYLALRKTHGLMWQGARWELARHIVLHALLLSLLWQMFMQPYSWHWFPDPTPMGTATGWATVLLLVGMMALITWITKFDFGKAGEVNATTTVREIENSTRVSFVGAGVLLIGLVVLWDRMAALLEGRFLIPRPYPVAEKGFDLLVRDSWIWTDIGVSAVELVAGVAITAIIALVLVNALNLFGAQRFVSRGLLIINTVPLIVSLLMMPMIGINVWLKAIIIASLSIYPFLQTLWALREHQLICRLVLALENALPYAFVGMLFGEAWAATAGLGFRVVQTQHSDRTDALAVSLITLGLMVIMSCLLRTIIKRLFLSRGTAVIPAVAGN